MNRVNSVMNIPCYIGKYRLFILATDYLEFTLDELADSFKHIPEGDVEEILVSYDNWYDRIVLRVTGRNDCLGLEIKKYVFLCEEGSAITAFIPFSKLLNVTTVREGIDELINYLRSII